MENMEEVLMELNVYDKKNPNTISPLLEEYLSYVAKTGSTLFPWVKIKPLFKKKLETVIEEFAPNASEEQFPEIPNVDHFSFDACKEKVFQQLDHFNGIPFTIQRLCELLTAPRKHYKRTDKFMRALEKNMLVVSTIDAISNVKKPAAVVTSGVSPSKSQDESEDLKGEPQKKVVKLSSGHESPEKSQDDDKMEVDEELTAHDATHSDLSLIQPAISNSQQVATEDLVTAQDVPITQSESELPSSSENSESSSKEATDIVAKDSSEDISPSTDTNDGINQQDHDSGHAIDSKVQNEVLGSADSGPCDSAESSTTVKETDLPPLAETSSNTEDQESPSNAEEQQSPTNTEEEQLPSNAEEQQPVPSNAEDQQPVPSNAEDQQPPSNAEDQQPKNDPPSHSTTADSEESTQPSSSSVEQKSELASSSSSSDEQIPTVVQEQDKMETIQINNPSVDSN